jgi:hypothetical protein
MIVIALAVIGIGFGAAHARAAAQDVSRNAAETQIGVLTTAANAYGLEHSGYVGMTPESLASEYGMNLDRKIARTLTISGTSTTSFCVQVQAGSWYVAQQGPGAAVVAAKQPLC